MTYDAKNRSLPVRVGYAWSGIRMAWRRERSFRAQAWTVLALLAVLVGFAPAPAWWALAGLAAALVLAAELVNSAFEVLTDHLHPETHPEIKRVKDIAAGSVLVAGLGALWVGGLMLLSLP